MELDGIGWDCMGLDVIGLDGMGHGWDWTGPMVPVALNRPQSIRQLARYKVCCGPKSTC